jgi:hypothetical protein
MNSKEPARGGMYKDVRYFNGGLFNEIIPIQLAESDIDILITASSQNWTAVRPSIFGTVLEATMSNEDRHAHGVHYTSEVDIYKIVRPTIVRYWDERIEEALSNEKKKAKNLRTLWNDLRKYKILDPACGSGNFLYIAYQEMKRIEKEIIDRLAENEGQVLKSFVSPYQFYGIDIKPFAVELTKLVLEIGRTIAIRKLNLNQEDPLPLDNLDKNIICADALFSEWPEANVIIGNPPFLGGKRLRTELGDEYVEKMYKAFPEVKGQPDFCVHWFRKAHQSSAERVGLVGTNSISQGQSREATLSYVVENDGIIHDAVSTQEWSGEAAVHVSIANWIKPLSPALKPPIPTFPLKEEGAKIGTAYAPLTSGEGPGVRAINTVREIMKELDEFRLAMIKERNYGITKLYNEFFNEPASKLSKLHKSLDEAVLKVYSEFPLSRGLGGKDGWKYDPNKNYNEQLFALNKEIYDKETNN